jgi:quercetin dioxygenase-like cupin family protein
MTIYADNRGEIRNVGNVAIIASKAGSVRSNHYHKEGWHLLYVLAGLMKYFERDVGGGNPENPITVGPGEFVLTGPLKEHRTEFLDDTIMLSLASPQVGGEHEKDTVGVEW